MTDRRSPSRNHKEQAKIAGTRLIAKGLATTARSTIAALKAAKDIATSK
jgi:hypothetical protein